MDRFDIGFPPGASNKGSERQRARMGIAAGAAVIAGTVAAVGVHHYLAKHPKPEQSTIDSYNKRLQVLRSNDFKEKVLESFPIMVAHALLSGSIVEQNLIRKSRDSLPKGSYNYCRQAAGILQTEDLLIKTVLGGGRMPELVPHEALQWAATEGADQWPEIKQALKQLAPSYPDYTGTLL